MEIDQRDRGHCPAMEEEQGAMRQQGSESPVHHTLYFYAAQGPAASTSLDRARFSSPCSDTRAPTANVTESCRESSTPPGPSWCRRRVELQHQQGQSAAGHNGTGLNCAHAFAFQGNGDGATGAGPNTNKLDSFSEAFPNRIFVRRTPSQRQQGLDAQSCRLQQFCSQRTMPAAGVAHGHQAATYSVRTQPGSPHTVAWQQHQQFGYQQGTTSGWQSDLPPETREFIQQHRVQPMQNFQHSYPSQSMLQEPQCPPEIPYTSLPTQESRGYRQPLEGEWTAVSQERKSHPDGLRAEPQQCFYQDFQQFTQLLQETRSEGATGKEEYLGLDPQSLTAVRETSPDSYPSACEGPVTLKTQPGAVYSIQGPTDRLSPAWDRAGGFFWYQDGQKPYKIPDYLPDGFTTSPVHTQREAATDDSLTGTVLSQKLPHAAGDAEEQVGPCSLPSYYTGVPFSSCLHLVRSQEDCFTRVPRYTPCPMLNPLRRGTGLFTNLLTDLWDYSSPTSSHEKLHRTTGSECVQQWESPHLYGTAEPGINLGPNFQAELPDLCNPITSTEESLREQLLWRPREELEWDADLQRRVDNVLNVACSSAFPGGGTNQELALHHISEAGGDVMGALERLLMKDPSWPKSHPLADYHYTGSDVWKPQERRLFSRAFSLHRKDFFSIHKMVKSKAPRQCVEYYYLQKKILRIQRKPSSYCWEESDSRGRQERAISCPRLTDSPLGGEALRAPSCASGMGSFPCKQCGKMFYKIKSRNAHMKIHRPQEEWRGSDGLRAQRPLPPTCTLEPTLLDSNYSLWSSRGGLQTFDLNNEALPCSGFVPQYAGDTKLSYKGRLFS